MGRTDLSSEKSEFFLAWVEDVRHAARQTKSVNLCPLFSPEAILWVLGHVKDEKHLMEAAGVEPYKRPGIAGNLYDAQEVYDGLFGGVQRGKKTAKNSASFGRGERSKDA